MPACQGPNSCNRKERLKRCRANDLQVGAKGLGQGGSWGDSQFLCSVQIGKTQDETSAVQAVDPVWGQPFFHAWEGVRGASAALEVVCKDRRMFGEEVVGRVRISMESVFSGLYRASAGGNKTWETYFLLHPHETSSEPFKPGSDASWQRPAPPRPAPCGPASLRGPGACCAAAARAQPCRAPPGAGSRLAGGTPG